MSGGRLEVGGDHWFGRGGTAGRHLDGDDDADHFAGVDSVKANAEKGELWHR